MDPEKLLTFVHHADEAAEAVAHHHAENRFGEFSGRYSQARTLTPSTSKLTSLLDFGVLSGFPFSAISNVGSSCCGIWNPGGKITIINLD